MISFLANSIQPEIQMAVHQTAHFSVNLHQACWPTSSRHARLSAACLVGATSDDNLSDGSNSMSIKTEIMSLGLDVKVIFCPQARNVGIA
jgi:hypothetical protein